MTTYLAIAGNIASGKTTLARLLCRRLGLAYAVRARPGKAYLDDLFSRPSRWAFEAQIAFLADKVAAIRTALKSGADFVVDRSFHEDVHVFAKVFHQRGMLGERSYATYLRVAALLAHGLPHPSLLVYCIITIAVCKETSEARA